MGRTQIYLRSDELELLDRVAQATGASRSELVRRAVRTTFGQPTKADKLLALEAWVAVGEGVTRAAGELARKHRRAHRGIETRTT